MPIETNANPKRYRELSEPFPAYAEADAACEAFYRDVMEARIKHKIADVSIISMIPYITGDGEETSTINSAHLGHNQNAMVLAAYLYGAAKTRHEEQIDVLAKVRKKLR